MRMRPDEVTSPSAQDPLVIAAAEVAGGPQGRYAAPRSWRRVGAALVGLTSIPLAIGVLERAPCISAGWNTPDQFWHACFSDLTTTYAGTGLSSGPWAYLFGMADAATPSQPPLTGLLMTGVAALVPDAPLDVRMRWYFALWAVLSAVLVSIVVWLTAASVPRRPVRAAHVALSPVVALTLLVATDIVGVVLASAALLAWGRRRLALAGVLLGLAISARTYPLVILAALLFLSLRAGRVRDWMRTAGYAALVAGGTFLVFFGLNADGAMRAYQDWATSGGGYGAVWVIPQLAGYPLAPSLVVAFAVGGWVTALLAGAVFALAGPRRPGLAEVSLVMLAVVMVTGSSMPVQSSLWLVPLVALVGLRWRDHLLWAGAELAHFIAVWLYIAGISVPSRGLPAGWYAVFLILRLVAVLWLLRQTWVLARSRWPLVAAQPGEGQRGHDAEDEPGEPGEPDELDEPDELAGVLTGCPDRFVITVARR